MDNTTKPTVLLLSSIHGTSDPRIAYKIAPTLATHYQVFCVLSNAHFPLTTVSNSTTKFYTVPFFAWIGWRILVNYPLILWYCFKVKPSIVHIFVAELIPIAFLLKLFKCEIIYEVQENLYKKLHLKKRNNHWLFRQCFFFFDQLARNHFHFIFTEDAYLQEYRTVRKSSIVIHNYSSKANVSIKNVHPSTPPRFLYIGVISLERGLYQILQAIYHLKEKGEAVEVHFFGHLKADLRQLPIYESVKSQVCFYPYADYTTLLQDGRSYWAGLAVLLNVGDYYDSYPSKLFDYMQMGIPVITSDFPLYKKVVSSADCGILIEPTNTRALADAMLFILTNREHANKMGKNGQKAINHYYNWETEAERLVNFYLSVKN